MIITISGLPGAGKDTIAKMLAKKLKYKYYSMGDIRGKWAQEQGKSLEEFLKDNEKTATVDNQLDMIQTKLGQEEDDFVIVGHMSGHFIPHALKIFLIASLNERARRVFKDLKVRPDEDYKDEKETKEALSRIQSMNERRYLKFYDHNPYLEKHYDMVIDTEKHKPDKVISLILNEMKKRKKT